MKSRKLAAGLALLGVITFPGIHRFYLGQPRWGLAYVLLAWKTPLSRIASGLEAMWYLFLDDDEFDRTFNPIDGLEGGNEDKNEPGLDPAKVEHIVNAVREMENLRQEGLITEAEFEQKRRKLLDQID